MAADGTSAWGRQPDLEPVADVYADHGGVVGEVWPERTRLTPATARQAAREFVTTGAHRPTCLHWDTPDTP